MPHSIRKLLPLVLVYVVPLVKPPQVAALVVVGAVLSVDEIELTGVLLVAERVALVETALVVDEGTVVTGRVELVEVVLVAVDVDALLTLDVLETALAVVVSSTPPVLVYAQISLPLKLALRYNALGRPSLIATGRLPEVSVVKTSQLSRSVNLVLALKDVFATGIVILPLLPAPRFVKMEMSDEAEAPFLVTRVCESE